MVRWAYTSDVRTLLTRQTVDPLVGFAFIQTFVDILREYFGGVSLAMVKENFDVVYQVSVELYHT